MRQPPRILVSACLLGIRCRYDGASQPLSGLERLLQRCAPIPVCPEQLGGLPTPRVPAECRGERVFDRNGQDVTAAFNIGAEQTCRLAERLGARLALLKARSPSCGKGTIYDGSFQGRLHPGNGVTAKALAELGVHVYTEEEIDMLLYDLEEMCHDTL